MIVTEPARKYRPGGHAWASEVPNHWSVGRLRWLSRRYAGGTPDKKNDDFWTGGTIPWLNSGAVNQSTITEPSAFITDVAYSRSSAKWIPKGALVMALAGQGKTKGMVAQLAISATCNQSMAAILPSEALSPRFLFWWLTANYQNIRNLAGGDDRDGLNLELIGDIRVPLPPLLEQNFIAVLLDCETVKIDALVQEQKQLIELLREKRQAVISHAVTKGIDPDAKMEDTGVEWLGEVPEHWEAVPLKRLVSIITSGPRGWSELEAEDGAVFFQSQNIGRLMDVIFEDATRINAPHDAESNRCRLQCDDVVVCITGGRTAAVAHVRHITETAYVNQHVCLIRPKAFSGRYLAYWLSSFGGQQQLQLSMYGLKQGLSLDDVGDVIVPCPNQDEQKKIVGVLDRETARIDELIRHVESGTQLLQERRAALISAAVTGKIGVRDTQPISANRQWDRSRVRSGVAAEIIDRLSLKPTFGRVKLQKIVYLAETHADIGELEGEYLREAAGPLDRAMIEEMEAELRRAGYLSVAQPDGRGGAVKYQVLGCKGAYREEIAATLGDRANKLSCLIDLMGDLETKSAEAVATLYAVWNDALQEGQTPTDDGIVKGVLQDWHPEKPKKFTVSELHTWVGWMRRHKLVPCGKGPKTSTGRLFP